MPAPTPLLSGLCQFRVATIRCGADHAAAITEDGELWMWGGRHGAPAVVPPPPPSEDSGRQSWQPNGWTLVACGTDCTVAVSGEGGCFTWGDGAHGRLGLGDTEPREAPTRVETISPIASVEASSPDDEERASEEVRDSGDSAVGAGSSLGAALADAFAEEGGGAEEPDGFVVEALACGCGMGDSDAGPLMMALVVPALPETPSERVGSSFSQYREGPEDDWSDRSSFLDSFTASVTLF